LGDAPAGTFAALLTTTGFAIFLPQLVGDLLFASGSRSAGDPDEFPETYAAMPVKRIGLYLMMAGSASDSPQKAKSSSSTVKISMPEPTVSQSLSSRLWLELF
jgi:hypothetical protein